MRISLINVAFRCIEPDNDDEEMYFEFVLLNSSEFMYDLMPYEEIWARHQVLYNEQNTAPTSVSSIFGVGTPNDDSPPPSDEDEPQSPPPSTESSATSQLLKPRCALTIACLIMQNLYDVCICICICFVYILVQAPFYRPCFEIS